MAQLKTGKFIEKKRKELNLSIRGSNSVRFKTPFFAVTASKSLAMPPHCETFFLHHKNMAF